MMLKKASLEFYQHILKSNIHNFLMYKNIMYKFKTKKFRKSKFSELYYFIRVRIPSLLEG